jgi:uncharacterized membrane protein
MPKHHIDLLLRISAYFGALAIIVGVTGATLVNYVPTLLPTFAVLFAFICSVVIVGAIAWAITKSDEYPKPANHWTEAA